MAQEDDDELYASIVASVVNQSKANAAKTATTATLTGASTSSQPSNGRPSRSKAGDAFSSDKAKTCAVDEDDIEVSDDGFSGGAGGGADKEKGRGKKGHGKRARPAETDDLDDVDVGDEEEGGRGRGSSHRRGAGGGGKKVRDEFAEYEEFLDAPSAPVGAPREMSDKEVRRLASAAGLRAIASAAGGGTGGQSDMQRRLVELAAQQAADEERRKQDAELRARVLAGDAEAMRVFQQRQQEKAARAGAASGSSASSGGAGGTGGVVPAPAAGGAAGGGGTGKADKGVLIEVKVQEDTKKTGRESKLFTMHWNEPFSVLLAQYRAVHGIAEGSREDTALRFVTPEGDAVGPQQTPAELYDMDYADTEDGKPRFFMERSSK